MAIETTDNRRVIYHRPDALVDRSTHYCPGCGHGIVHRLIAEIFDELDLTRRTIGVGSVGCSVFAYDYFKTDFVESPHGRAPAVATGVRRVQPEKFVFTYQGDGDLAAIGTAEIVHAAARGELFTAVFVNNGIYGMTGGQMAPTTLVGQRTTSSPTGRETGAAGWPIPITEMLAILPGTAYAARGSIANPQLIGRTKQMLKRAFELQEAKAGFTMVEVLSTCPVGWGMTPDEVDGPRRAGGTQDVPARSVDRPAGAGVRCRRGREVGIGGLTMEFSSIFAGFGGQGLLFCGNVLAQAAVLEGREVSWMPSYGPEMRGGTASCTVIIADRPIGSPMTDAPDAVVVLNPPSLAKFEPLIVPDGLLVINASLIEAEASRADIEVLSMPCTQIAREAGDDRLVALSPWVACSPGGRSSVTTPPATRFDICWVARRPT